MPVTVYVLKGREKDRRYVGITKDLARRVREHASGTTKAGQLLGKFEVLYTEGCANHREARAREKYLKSGQGRKWLDEFEARTRPARGG